MNVPFFIGLLNSIEFKVALDMFFLLLIFWPVQIMKNHVLL